MACGAGHSLALAKPENEGTTSVYTWGRGWFGQLGTGKFDSQYSPAKIEFAGNKSLSFVMATCGDQHTLLLDAEGNIWFAGQMLAIGLGSADCDKLPTFATLSALSKEVPAEAMLYIATGQNHNLSLSGTGKVYAFGKNDYCKSGGKAELETVFFQQIKTNEVSMSLVSCGKKHSVACDIRGYPYAWGNFTLGRLGIHPKNFDQREKESLCIDRPKEIFKLKTAFMGKSQRVCNHGVEEIGKLGAEEDKDHGKNDPFLENVKYSTQKKLMIESSESKEDALCKQYILLTEKLREVIKSFAKNAKKIKSQMLVQQLQLANSVTSRIYSTSQPSNV